MAYAAKDKSVNDGAPVEFYKFTGDFGTYRFTTDNVAGTCNGEIYLPIEGGVSRSAIELTTAVDNIVTVDIELPVNNPVAQAVAFKQNPDVWEVEIRRAHRGDDWSTEWSLEWWGFGLGSSVSGDTATLQTGDAIQQFFGRTIPNVVYKRSCNHKLYDDRCKVDVADWTLTTTVTKVQASFVTVDNDQAANDDLLGGQAVLSRTGEVRPILRNTDNVLKIAYPFVDILVGDEIKLIYGCDHRQTGDCLQRFNNTLNYGGFDDIPATNPFADLTLNQLTTTTETDTRMAQLLVRSVGSTSSGGGGGDVQMTRYGPSGTSSQISAPYVGGSTPLPPFKVKSLGSSSTLSSEPVSIKGKTPTSQLGGVVPYLTGRRRIAKPNIIQFGEVKPLYETSTVTETTYWTDPKSLGGGSFHEYVEKTVTTEVKTPIGFTTDIVCALCLGPGAKLREIWIGENRIWNGNVGPTGTFTIDDNDYGLSGVECYFTGGAFDQPVAPGIDSDTCYPGVAYIVLRNVRADIGLGELTFEVERYPQPFGSSGNISNLDINVASAMYDLITNEWGGLGIPVAYIGTSFTAAFDYFKTHYGYGSVVVDAATSGGTVVQLLQQQVNSSIYSSPKTGKLELVISSESEYDRGSAINIGPSSMRNLSGFNKTGWNDTAKDLTITYSNRATSYEPAQIIAKGTEDNSPLQSKKSLSVGFPYICQQDVAVYVGKRLLAENYVPSFSGKVTVNRKGADAVPGAVSVLNIPHYGLWSTPIIIDRVRKNPMSENTVDLTFRQWSTPDGTDISVRLPEDGDDFTFGYEAKAPTDAFVQTVPFWLLRAAGIIDINTVSDVVYPMFFPIPATPLQAFVNVSLERAGVTPPSYIKSGVTYPGYGTLDTAIAKTDGWTDGEIASIEISGAANVGDLPDMSSIIHKGRYLLLIGSEMFTFETAEDLGSSRLKLNNLNRAVIDTVAADHNVGDSVFIISNNYNYISGMAFPNPLEYTPTWRFVSNTTVMNGKIDRPEHTLTKAGWVPVYHRSIAPPRPHDTKVDGVRSTDRLLVMDGSVVSWRTRTRVASQIEFQTDASEDSEPTSETTYQKHRVYIKDSGGTTRLIGTTADDENDINSLTLTLPGAIVAGNGTLFVRSVVNDIESVFDDAVDVFVVPATWRITEDRDLRTTEDDEQRIVE